MQQVVQDFWQRSQKQVRICWRALMPSRSEACNRHTILICGSIRQLLPFPAWLQGIQRQRGPPLRADYILLVVFSGNFIGVLCARTLHFQFYSWYYHTLPFLLWQVRPWHGLAASGPDVNY